jgi:hypothetical protein
MIMMGNDTALLGEIKSKMKTDEEIQDILKKLRKGEWQDNKTALGLCKEQNELLTYDRLIWVPQDDNLHLHLLHDYHDVLVAGHPGGARTLELLSRKYYWPHQCQYVQRYVDNCDTCKRIKPTRYTPFGLLKPLQLPTRPWDSISMDFIMGLPETEGCNALWVIVDCLTQMSHFIACKDTMGPHDLAKEFLLHVIWAHGLPSSIISDRGLLFTCKFCGQVMKAMGMT